MRTSSTVATLVAAAAALAGCGGHAPAPVTSPAPAPVTTAPAPASEGRAAQAAAEPARTVANAPAADRATGAAGRAAVRAAVAFMRREIGMPAPVAGRFHPTGSRTGDVEVRPGRGEGGRPWEGPVTVVSLYRLDSGAFWVTGTRTRDITVTGPARLARVASPVTVTGRALAFEGSVQVTVTADRDGRDLVLGRETVTGSGDGAPGPFSGRVAYRRPPGSSGSVIFAELSAADGSPLKATVVRVRFDRSPLADRVSDPLAAADQVIAAWVARDAAAVRRLTSPAVATRLLAQTPPAARPAGTCRLISLGRFLCSYPLAAHAELSLVAEGGASAGYHVTGLELGD